MTVQPTKVNRAVLGMVRLPAVVLVVALLSGCVSQFPDPSTAADSEGQGTSTECPAWDAWGQVPVDDWTPYENHTLNMTHRMEDEDVVQESMFKRRESSYMYHRDITADSAVEYRHGTITRVWEDVDSFWYRDRNPDHGIEYLLEGPLAQAHGADPVAWLDRVPDAATVEVTCSRDDLQIVATTERVFAEVTVSQTWAGEWGISGGRVVMPEESLTVDVEQEWSLTYPSSVRDYDGMLPPNERVLPMPVAWHEESVDREGVTHWRITIGADAPWINPVIRYTNDQGLPEALWGGLKVGRHEYSYDNFVTWLDGDDNELLSEGDKIHWELQPGFERILYNPGADQDVPMRLVN